MLPRRSRNRSAEHPRGDASSREPQQADVSGRSRYPVVPPIGSSSLPTPSIQSPSASTSPRLDRRAQNQLAAAIAMVPANVPYIIVPPIGNPSSVLTDQALLNPLLGAASAYSSSMDSNYNLQPQPQQQPQQPQPPQSNPSFASAAAAAAAVSQSSFFDIEETIYGLVLDDLIYQTALDAIAVRASLVHPDMLTWLADDTMRSVMPQLCREIVQDSCKELLDSYFHVEQEEALLNLVCNDMLTETLREDVVSLTRLAVRELVQDHLHSGKAESIYAAVLDAVLVEEAHSIVEETLDDVFVESIYDWMFRPVLKMEVCLVVGDVLQELEDAKSSLEAKEVERIYPESLADVLLVEGLSRCLADGPAEFVLRQYEDHLLDALCAPILICHFLDICEAREELQRSKLVCDVVTAAAAEAAADALLESAEAAAHEQDARVNAKLMQVQSLHALEELAGTSQTIDRLDSGGIDLALFDSLLSTWMT
eukprot:m.108383 g.108383  ORF g.108383 m.108383 type:complete len:481 (+) comp15865_c1_seq3:392-1834(+)